MSPLTRLFVVLLVVLSLAISAATVVFVNTAATNADALATSQRTVAQLRSESDRLKSELASQQQTAQLALKNAQDATNAARRDANQAQQLIADRDARLAELGSRLAMQTADMTRLTEALNSSEKTKQQQGEQIAQLRQTNDNLQRQNGDLNLAVSDLTNKLNVTERERQFLSEQLAESKNQNDRLGAILRDQGISPDQVAAAGVKGGAPPINGVIRDTRTIAGVPYATISVGATDMVKRGMEFKVVNHATGEFLGLITVDSVEQTESTGRLQGPHVDQIGPGAEVRTQL